MQVTSNNKTLTVDPSIVAEVMSANIQRPILNRRFKFDLPAQKVLDVLTYYFADEVRQRGRQMILDANSQGNLIAVAKALVNPGHKFGIMLCGNCGNGKTTMMHAIRRSIDYVNDVEKGFEFLRDPDTKRIPRLSLECYDVKSLLAKAKKQQNYDAIKQHFLLGIDDLGKEPREIMDYGSVNTPVIDLLEYRYNRMLFTVVTTNLTWNELADKYDRRIIDRFYEFFHVIPFKDISYRRIQ